MPPAGSLGTLLLLRTFHFCQAFLHLAHRVIVCRSQVQIGVVAFFPEITSATTWPSDMTHSDLVTPSDHGRNACSATMRREKDWLSMLQGVQSALCFLEPFSNVRQSSRVRSQQVHMSKQLNKAESNEDMKTSDKQVRLKEGQQKDNKLDVQLN